MLRAAGVDLESAWDTTQVGKEVVLVAGTDFDRVVVGLSVGALKTIGRPLGLANKDFGAMLDDGRTVEVLAAQAWLQPTAAWLGVPAPGVVLAGEGPVTDTYADMTHVLAAESWPRE